MFRIMSVTAALGGSVPRRHPEEGERLVEDVHHRACISTSSR